MEKKTWNSGETSQEGQPTKINPRAHRQLIQEVWEEAWTTSKALQASFQWFNNMKLTRNNTKAHLTFTTKHLDDPQDFWEKTFCGLTRQKWNFLEDVRPVTSGLKLTQNFRTTCCHWWNHEFCTLPENPEGECAAVSLWPKARAHLGSAAGRWSKTHQQVQLWMSKKTTKKKKKNEGFGVAQSKSGLKSSWDAVAWNRPFMLQNPPMWLN